MSGTAYCHRLRKGSKLLYRKPAYLICTDPDMPLEEVLQYYIWRWDIEVNHRDEKQIIGVGQAQVRSEKSVSRHPVAVADSDAKGLASVAKRFGLWIYGTKGIVTTTMGAFPQAWFIEDPAWQSGENKAKWRQVSSSGIDKGETRVDRNHHFGNRLIALDLIDAIESDRQPLGGMYDGRAALEMILAVYESHRLGRAVEIPLKNRKHPLSRL